MPAALIAKKRDGDELSDDEIEFLISGYTDGSIPDYQMSAWAMAVYFQGLVDREIDTLTAAMLASGDVLTQATDRPRVDKHSTGGLGDKVSLILAPLLAVCDVDVPMLSGRGLGITGGTLDKLESIPGFRTDLSEQEIASALQSTGCVITGASGRLVPADQKLYGLRDVTATVPVVPLIASSIMSKKLAESLNALVLDVKWGSGAFMQTRDEAIVLGRALQRIGNAMGVPTKALLTDMTQPLGQMVGNACEVNESLDVLRGDGPDDVRRLTVELCAELIVMVDRAADIQSARSHLASRLSDGSAYERFIEMVGQQGGRLDGPLVLDDAFTIESQHAGIVQSFDGQQIGRVVIELGGGRRVAGQSINHRVGLEFQLGVGDTVELGQPIATVFCQNQAQFERAAHGLLESIAISQEPVIAPDLFEAI